MIATTGRCITDCCQKAPANEAFFQCARILVLGFGWKGLLCRGPDFATPLHASGERNVSSWNSTLHPGMCRWRGIMIDYGRLRTDLFALAILAMAVFLGLSLVSYDPADPPATAVFPVNTHTVNLCGIAGASLAHGLVIMFGAGAYFVLIALIVLDIRLLARDNYNDPLIRVLGAGLLLVTVTVAAQWYLPVSLAGSLTGSGGYLGASTGLLLDEQFSRVGSLILLGTATIAGLLLTGEQHLLKTAVCVALIPITMWSRLAFGARTQSKATDSNPQAETAKRRGALVPLEEDPFDPANDPVSKIPVKGPPLLSSASKTQVVVAKGDLSAEAAAAIASMIVPLDEDPTDVDDEPLVPSAEADDVEIVDDEDSDGFVPASFSLSPERAPIRVNPPVGMRSPDGTPKPKFEPAEKIAYELPDTSILDDSEEFPYDILASKAQIAAGKLEETFKEFGLNVKVVEIDTGPVITQFELELEKGLRLSKVTSLADDLAIALRVPSVRVIAPIPGKNTVGVEVPNDVRVMVRLKELIDSCGKDIDSKAIPMFLGKDASGKPLVVDMCKMPHLLIAGRTGTGKSVCLNTLIVSMLMTRSPDQVKMLMIDPKMVELSPYSRIPHLMHPVITDMKKAEAVLGWAVDKMEERYQLLSAAGVRHVDSYNKMGREKVLKKLGLEPDSEEAAMVPETMPYIVIVADEMADMMMTSGKDVEGHIIRLAQKSRAVGIHLVLATQKPTVDVITGLIKSNLPARISFQVASRMDSRVVLDEMGADKLLGKGDMLYMAPETSSLQRAQGTYVSDDEVNKVIEFFADQEPQYDEELVQLKAAAAPTKGGKAGGASEPRERDEMYDDAVEVVIREGRGSVSLLQRALGVGYGRGARMIDWMAEDGIVGGYNGSQAREVVMTMIDWEEAKEARNMAGGRK